MILIEQFLWVIYPYITLSVFIIGLLLRYNNDQRGWSSKSSEILEKHLLKWGSTLFHGGIIFVFFGHVGGLLMPLSFYRIMGVSDEAYHTMALGAGGVSGIATTVGLCILLYRRFLVKRISITSTFSDRLAIVMLAIVVFFGMLVTVLHARDTSGFDYRATIGPWLRGIITFTPNVFLMTTVPVLFKIHVFLAFTFFALMPFTRMVHIVSQPITYISRRYIVYRRRA